MNLNVLSFEERDLLMEFYESLDRIYCFVFRWILGTITKKPEQRSAVEAN